MNTSYNLSAIIELLNPDNTISAHRYIAHAIGMTETIIYSALIAKQTYYLKNAMFCEDGWFYSTVNDLQESTTFGIKAQRTAIAHLVEHGLIECEMKGISAKRYFRISENAESVENLTFSEALTAIGVKFENMVFEKPISEKQFEFWSEEERKTQNCKIPSYLKNDKTAFKNALKYLCGFSYYFSEHQGTKLEKFFEMLIDTIADMSDEHNDLTERLNDIISRNYLGECFIAFEQRWTKISSEKEIAHPKAYLRSCLWNWLCDYENISLLERQ